MKLLAVVIAYNPNYADIRKNIYSYCNNVDHLIVWNNTPHLTNDECRNLLALDKSIRNVEIKGDGKNHLIAYPINRVIEWGLEKKFTHILTMDQDSQFEEDGLSKYRDCILSFDSDIYGTNLNLNGHIRSNKTKPHFVYSVITSGSIYKLEIFNKLGLLREDYGIDAVDIEICYRAIMNGCKVNMIPTVMLNHNMGYITKSKLGFYTRNYSAFRLYHIIRNETWLYREYPQLFKKARRQFYLHLFAESFVKILLAEDNKYEKIRSLFRGLYDGLFSLKRVVNEY